MKCVTTIFNYSLNILQGRKVPTKQLKKIIIIQAL